MTKTNCQWTTLLVLAIVTLHADAADFGAYRQHTEMPALPKAAADYENMWDSFALRAAATGAPLEVTSETSEKPRVLAGFDTLPWNGRQLARDAAGSWYVLTELKQRAIMLASGRASRDDPSRPRGGDLPAIELVGPDEGAVFQDDGAPTRASMVIGDDQRLHVIYHRQDGLWHLSAKLGPDAPGSLYAKAAWTAPERLVEGPCRAGDIMRAGSGGIAICYAQQDVVKYRWLAAGEPEVVGQGLPPLRRFSDAAGQPEDDAAAAGLGALRRDVKKIPLHERESQDAVMDLAPDGTVWLAFRRDFGIWVARRGAGGGWSRPELVVREYAFNPSLIVANGRPLLVYHHDGLRPLPLDVGTDLRKRAGGGAALGYATLTDRGWHLGELAAPEEIAVFRRGMWAQRGTGRLLPQIEQLGWPVLFRDAHGVAWALWQNSTRRWACSARWLGESFGEVQECRGPFNAPRPAVNAEKLAPAGAGDVGVLFHAATAGGNDRAIFDRLRIPSLSITEEREVLFLDALEIAETSGAELKLNPMTKPISVPALSPPEGVRVAEIQSVSKLGDLYAMRYRSSFTAGSGTGHWATSKDGLHFDKVDALPAGLPEAAPAPERPLEFWRGASETRPPLALLNPDRSDPAKKFVRLIFSTEARGSYWVQYSPDEREWTKGQQITATEAMREQARPDFFAARDPDRPLRTYGRVYTETGRSWGVIWSRDLLRWSGLEHLLDPDDPYGKASELSAIGATGKNYTMRGQVFLDAVAGRGEDEIYAASVRRAEGLYFCFYWPGRQGRPLTDVGVAVSRDGFNFTRVKNGERILPLGPPGAWDAGYIFQMHPMLDGDQVRVFYRATAGRREGSDGFGHNLTEIGVATIRVNGFTFYTPREAGKAATVTTIPIRAPAGTERKLTVNVDGTLGDKAAFAVEILDAATGQPVPGYASADCLLGSGDGTAMPIAWNGGVVLPSGKEIRLRFHLQNSRVRLYSFGFR